MSAILAAAIRYWWAIALAGLVVLLGVQTKRLGWEQDAHKVTKASIAVERQLAAEATAKAEREQRAEETRRQKERDDAIKYATERAAALARDASLAGAAAERLRSQLAAFTARNRQAGCNPAASRPGAPAGDPIGVLADVLGRCDARAGLLGKIADDRGAAGATCERYVDALSKPAAPAVNPATAVE